jgi:outer membrane protein assembly factor BamB
MKLLFTLEGEMKFKVSCLLVLLLLVSVFVVGSNFRLAKAGASSQVGLAQAADADQWPMFHHDPTHSGYTNSTGPTTNQTIWTYKTGVNVDSSPAVSGGVVYIGSMDFYVYALNATTGTLVWRYETGLCVDSSPTVAGGVVYVGSDDDYVYALNATTGTPVWRYKTGSNVHSSPAVCGDVVYIGSSDFYLYALNATTGTLVWRYKTGNSIWSSPTVGGGVLYFDSYDSYVYALNATTGTLVWRCLPYGLGWVYSTSSPAVYGGVVYTDERGDPCLYALDAATGAVLWQFEARDETVSSPAVCGGIVYISSYDNYTYALNSVTGALVWRYRTGVSGSSVAVCAGVVYVGSDNSDVYAFGSPPTYSVSVSESGLPQGARWSVTFNGQTQSSTSNSTTFSAVNGVYPFSIASPAGYIASPSSGSITVSWANVVEQIAFKATYEVSFVESGLPQGARWSVTFNGQTQSSTSNSIAFDPVNGVYPFSVTPPTGYGVSPSYGSITINRANATEQITFIYMSVSMNKMKVVEGDTVTVNVTLKNGGNCTETFNVALYGSQYGCSWSPWLIYKFTNVTLAPGSATTLTIPGLGFGVGFYTLTANAYQIGGMTYTSTSATILVAPIALFRPWVWHRPIPI